MLYLCMPKCFQKTDVITGTKIISKKIKVGQGYLSKKNKNKTNKKPQKKKTKTPNQPNTHACMYALTHTHTYMGGGN